MQIYKKTIVLILTLVLSASYTYANDKKIHEIGDDSALRISLSKTLFTESPRSVLSQKPVIRTLPSGERVEVRVVRGSGSGEFSIMIAREATRSSASGNVPAGTFPGWAQGSFVLTRDLSTGEPLRATVFLRSDPYAYIQFRPLDNYKSLLDAIVYDAFVTEGMPVAVPFERVLVSRISDVLALSGERFPRRYYEPEPADYRDTRLLIGKVREKIRGLEFGDDGALNEKGEYVYIATGAAQQDTRGLNCSGFVKWLIDGLLSPLTGKKLEIEPLKQPFGKRGSNFSDPFEESRDPYFGLDWSRNLAAVANSTFKSAEFADIEETSVNRAAFATLITRSGSTSAIRHYPGYLGEAGFGFEGIQPLLYTLAIDEPHNIYLAAINTVGGTPPLRTYFHIAALFPYFDEDGNFRVAIFESAEETSFNRFRVRYPSHYVNLSRIPVRLEFEP
jgi:hypothetical protein